MNDEKTLTEKQTPAERQAAPVALEPVVMCRRLKGVTVDAKIEAEFPQPFRFHWRQLTAEDKAQELERACREFDEFIRDHRSQDPVTLEVVRVTKDLCSNCEREWEPYEENGETICAGCGAKVEGT